TGVPFNYQITFPCHRLKVAIHADSRYAYEMFATEYQRQYFPLPWWERCLAERILGAAARACAIRPQTLSAVARTNRDGVLGEFLQTDPHANFVRAIMREYKRAAELGNNELFFSIPRYLPIHLGQTVRSW